MDTITYTEKIGNKNQQLILFCRNKYRQLYISELARVCDISRTTAYKYKSLLEA
jgi:hypothetical protein